MECPAFETLAGLVRGELSDSMDLDEHVRSCASCQKAVDRIEGETSEARRTSTLAAAGMQKAKLDLDVGAIVGRYVIESVVGEGAMGVVYAARDPELGRLVALKVIKGEVAESERVARLREARALAVVEHPNVIGIYDVGTHQGHPFLAMELVSGSTFKGWLREKERPWQEVLAMFLQAGEGLLAAHDRGLVHRDFKPDNVLVGNDGRARVTDFGLARMVSADAGGDGGGLEEIAGPAYQHALTDTITRTGALIGTPAYMPHEQLRGESVDATADQFSFCVALFEGLYGVRPFAADSLLDLVHALREGEIREVERQGVPDALRAALLIGLAHKPADRHPSMRELLSALEEAAAAESARPASGDAAVHEASPEETAPSQPVSSSQQESSRPKRLSGVVGWAVAAVAVGALAAVVVRGGKPAVSPPAPGSSATTSSPLVATAAPAVGGPSASVTTRGEELPPLTPSSTAQPRPTSVASPEIAATSPLESGQPAAIDGSDTNAAPFASGKRGPGICTRLCEIGGACVSLGRKCVARFGGDCKASRDCKRFGRCSYDGNKKCVAASDSDCAGSLGCKLQGRCRQDGSLCAAARVSDCKRASACTAGGRCGLKDGKCVALSTADCRASSSCLSEGECTKEADFCKVRSDEDCKHSSICKQKGKCAFNGRSCVGGSAAKCAQKTNCKRQGECGFDKGRCKPTSAAHCAQSSQCKRLGYCGLDKGRCKPTSAAHCQQSYKCTRGGQCGLVNGRCVPTSAAHCQQSSLCKQEGFCNFNNNSCTRSVHR